METLVYSSNIEGSSSLIHWHWSSKHTYIMSCINISCSQNSTSMSVCTCNIQVLWNMFFKFELNETNYCVFRVWAKVLFLQFHVNLSKYLHIFEYLFDFRETLVLKISIITFFCMIMQGICLIFLFAWTEKTNKRIRRRDLRLMMWGLECT